MGFTVLSWLGKDRNAVEPSKQTAEQHRGQDRADVSSEMISSATGLSLEEIRQLFD